HAYGKVERQYAAALEQRVERRERLRLAWRGFFGIGAARRAERAMHGRTVIEKREKDDDPFRDRGREPVVEPAQPVQVPALYGLELVSSRGPPRRLGLLHAIRHAAAIEVGLERGLVRVRHVVRV